MKTGRGYLERRLLIFRRETETKIALSYLAAYLTAIGLVALLCITGAFDVGLL